MMAMYMGHRCCRPPLAAARAAVVLHGQPQRRRSSAIAGQQDGDPFRDANVPALAIPFLHVPTAHEATAVFETWKAAQGGFLFWSGWIKLRSLKAAYLPVMAFEGKTAAVTFDGQLGYSGGKNEPYGWYEQRGITFPP
jgi:hypothetical protein